MMPRQGVLGPCSAPRTMVDRAMVKMSFAVIGRPLYVGTTSSCGVFGGEVALMVLLLRMGGMSGSAVESKLSAPPAASDKLVLEEQFHNKLSSIPAWRALSEDVGSVSLRRKRTLPS